MSKEKENEGLFVAMKLAPDTLEQVKTLMKEIDLDNRLPDHELHVTTMFSLKEAPDFEIDPDFRACSDEPEFEFAIMGEEPFRALVLKFKSEALQRRHQEIREAGADYTYMSYLPHLSLSYEVDEDSIILDELNEKTVKFRICLSKEFSDTIEGFD